MIFFKNRKTLKTFYSDKFPSSQRFGRAILGGIPNSFRGEDWTEEGDGIGFITPDFHKRYGYRRVGEYDFYYGDHAYFGRSKYFRITKNSEQLHVFENSDGQRFKKLKLTIAPWKRQGSFVLLCPQSPTFFELKGLDESIWIQEVTTRIREATDRPIRIHRKKIGDAELEFEAALEDCWAVVVYSSLAGMQATLHGVPCFTTSLCTSSHFGHSDLLSIEEPLYIEDRFEKMSALADNQWTLEEIRSGFAYRNLLER